MNLEITHRTRYSYGSEVALEPHVFRFCPRNDGGQKLVDFSIRIEPEPSMQTACLDLEGNVVTHAWFEAATEFLLIHTSCLVETNRSNPYDYTVSGSDAATIPMLYPEECRSRVAPYCDNAPIEWEVRAFSDSVAADVGWDTSRFLPALNARINSVCQYEIRTMGDPHPSGLTLKTKTGACRDLAVLYIDACRAQGLAARFVSGYKQGSEEWESNEMHAWAEVYVPGGGWRGFDPSHALAASDRLVAVAAAVDSRGASPVSGTYRGSGPVPKLEFKIAVK
jgi:transglutaminase-like putative cysteine protease